MQETQTDRKKRLAEQLRNNLRRRKAQSREVLAGDGTDEGLAGLKAEQPKGPAESD